MILLDPTEGSTRVIRYRNPAAFLLLASWLLCCADVSWGQGFFRPPPNALAGRLIEPPRSLQQKLKEAKAALEENRPSDAVLALGDLVARETEDSADSDLADQDFFLDNDDVHEGNPARQSLLRTAQQMVGELSESDWETYQLRFGPIAERLLEQAADSHDWNAVAEVRRRYLHTLAGYQATALLAQREIYRGHPLAASILLKDIAEIPRVVKHLGPAIVLMYASSQHDAFQDGSPEYSVNEDLDTSAVSIPAIDQSPVKDLFFGKELLSESQLLSAEKNGTAPSSLKFASMEELQQWLVQRSKKLQTYRSPLPQDYPMYGSSANRNGNSAGQMPLTNMRWALPTTASHLQEKLVRELTSELAGSGRLPPPSWVPLRVGDQLLMRTTERLVGVDFKTGKRVWTYPWQSGWEPTEDDEILFDELSANEETDERISGRVWNDVPYGQVTSDGERVFMLTDLSDINMASFSQSMMIRGTRPAENRSNTLVALEMETEGKLMWRLGQNGEPTSPLSQAFFLGPPLPLEGRLYVMAEISGDILLCCLNPANGNLIWRQHLVAIESGGIDTDALRRVSGAMPTYHEGMLICPTGAGACIAIHLGDRTLAWGAVYDRSNDMMRVNNRGRGLEPSKLMQRWDNGIAVGSGTKLLVTPPETDRLLGFDLQTGKSLFQYKNRVNMKYLAGIRDGMFLLVSATEVRAFELGTGKLLWSSPQDFLAAGQHIAGRGIFGDSEYILPTTTNELIRVSLKDGSVLQRRSTRYPLGNLVAVDGEVIIQSPTMLAVAFGEKTLEPIVDKRLAENPDDFDALVRKSELLIQKGRRREALEMLKHARRLQADNDEVHLLSVSAMLGMLLEDPEIGEDYIEDLNNLIDRPAQRVELLSLRIRGAMKQKQWVKATEQAMALSDLLLSDDTAEGLAKDVVADPTRSCSLDCWLATRMSEVFANADSTQQEQINDLIQDAAKTQIEKPNATCERWIRHFNTCPGVASARMTLSGRYLESKQWLSAERLLLGTKTIGMLSGSTPPDDDRLIDLAEVYADGGMPEDAANLLASLSEKTTEDELPNIAELQILAESKIASHIWPEGVSVKWASPNIGNQLGMLTKRTSETTVLSGDHFAGWRLTNEGRAPLALRDPKGQSHIIAIEGVRGIDSRENEALISGGTMIVTMPTGLICIDLFRMLTGDSSVLWRHVWGGDGGGVAKRSPVTTPFGDQALRRKLSTVTAPPADQIPEIAMGPIMGDRCFVLQGGDLIALDILTGEILWRNSAAPKNGMVVSDGKQVAVISDAAQKAMFFDIGDGQKLDTLNWQHGKLWQAAGRHVLTYNADAQARVYQTKLVDPFANAVLLEQKSSGIYRNNSVAPLAYSKVIDGRFLCSMQSDGEAIIWDIDEGREVAKQRLTAYDDLQGLSALRLDGQFILAPKRKIVRTRRKSLDREVATTSGRDHQTVHAIFAISENGGELNWTKELDSPWGCTLDQASGTPMLVLTRSPYTNSVSTRVRKKYMDVLALDINDGHVLKEILGRDIKPGNNHLQTETIVQPNRNQVIVKVGNDVRLTFKFGAPTQNDVGEDDDMRDSEIDELKRHLELQLQIPQPLP